MKMQKAKTNTCLIHSVAMLLDEPADKLIKELGTDGLPHGLHIQSIMDLLARRGLGLVCYEADPVIGSYTSDREIHTVPSGMRQQRLRVYMHRRAGILITRTRATGHACAWDGHDMYDPRGTIGPPLEVDEFWMLVRL